MARILVTDAEQRSSLATVRSLGRAGHHVVVCSARPRPLAGASRFARKTLAVTDPEQCPAHFSEDVVRIVGDEDIEVLLPMTDVSLPVLLSLRESLPEVRIPFASLERYQAISDKRNLIEVARRIGVPVPRQTVVERREEVGRWDVHAMPLGLGRDTSVVLKPARSAVVESDGIRRFGVRILDSARQAKEALEGFPEQAFPVLVQERIVGPGLGAFMLADRGRTLATFGHRRIREKPPTGGVSVYREAVPLRPDVRAHAERILESFEWTGVAMVEFKEDARTGTPYLMEVNGRLWGSLQLAVDAGVDFPRLLVELALGGTDTGNVGEPREGIRSRWLWGDVDHLLWMLRRAETARAHDPTLPGRLGALARFLVPWRPGDRFEVLRLSDPGPFLRESVQWISAILAR